VNLSVPGAIAGSSLAFVVQVKEGFSSAFKAVGSEASQVATTLAGNGVVAGTRIALTFTNVPSNVSLYVPNAAISSITAQGGTPVFPPAQISLTASGAGSPFAGSAGSTIDAIAVGTGMTAVNGLAPVLIAGGVGSATFEVTQEDLANLDTFNIPVFVVVTPNPGASSSSNMTVAVSFSPTGSTVVPGFAAPSAGNTFNASFFQVCSTSLLFPFVTNELGFDTGFAISNTSTDPFGARGAIAQTGSCTLSFYGVGAPFPNSITTPSILTGTTYAFPLSSVAVGFQGYAIAQCQFQFAHGFAFVTNGLGALGGLSQGYLAPLIPDANVRARVADPLSTAPAGSGESLGN
jgi:hypothetical protein